MVKISKKYIPKETEKYMCAKHLAYFKQKLMEWKKDLKRTNNEAIFNASMDDNSASADIATWSWIARHKRHDIGLENFKGLSRWYVDIAKRPAVIKGFKVLNKDAEIDYP